MFAGAFQKILCTAQTAGSPKQPHVVTAFSTAGKSITAPMQDPMQTRTWWAPSGVHRTARRNPHQASHSRSAPAAATTSWHRRGPRATTTCRQCRRPPHLLWPLTFSRQKRLVRRHSWRVSSQASGTAPMMIHSRPSLCDATRISQWIAHLRTKDEKQQNKKMALGRLRPRLVSARPPLQIN